MISIVGNIEALEWRRDEYKKEAWKLMMESRRLFAQARKIHDVIVKNRPPKDMGTLKRNIEMYKLRAGGMMFKDIAARFGRSVTTANRVCLVLDWKIDKAESYKYEKTKKKLTEASGMTWDQLLRYREMHRGLRRGH